MTALILDQGCFFYLCSGMKNTLLIVGLWFAFSGCEKKIDIKLKDESTKVVIEGSIENDQAPFVTLMRSFAYFSEITSSQLSQAFIHNAEVYISNGALTHKLKEYSVPLTPAITYYYYSTDSSSLSTAFMGELNHSYSLRVVSEGKEYAATTTIPKITKKIDSLWWKFPPGATDTSKVVVMVRVTDPPGFGDYIRYYTKINRQAVFLPPVASVFDDLFIDGTTYEVQLQPGIDRNSDSAENDFFFRGDTVTFKLSNIDRTTFDFWRTWEFSYSSIGNPFSTPTKIIGNISNNALGYFAGYASQYRTLIIPH
jgi:hypothetical protein